MKQTDQKILICFVFHPFNLTSSLNP